MSLSISFLKFFADFFYSFFTVIMDRASRGPRNKGGRINRNKGLPVAARKLLVEQANKKVNYFFSGVL